MTPKGVFDIFGSSNTTGFTAEALRRKWITDVLTAFMNRPKAELLLVIY